MKKIMMVGIGSEPKKEYCCEIKKKASPSMGWV
jgi:hypothetical protein